MSNVPESFVSIVPTSQPINPQPQKEVSNPADVVAPKSHSKLKKLFITIGGLLLVLFIILGYLVFKGVQDAPQVKKELTTFLEYVSSGQLDKAYTLTSKQFKESTPKDDFYKAMTLFKAQYSGFKEQNQTGFSVEANAGQPTLYKYTGVITYIDGDNGELFATLVKENGEWKILMIKVNVDIKRFEKFQQSPEAPVLGVTDEK